MLLLIIKASTGDHLVLPAQAITCTTGLTVEIFREENIIRMRQIWVSRPREKLYDLSSLSIFCDCRSLAWPSTFLVLNIFLASNL